MTSADSCAAVATFESKVLEGVEQEWGMCLGVKDIKSLVKASLMPELSNCSPSSSFAPVVDTVTSGLTKPNYFLSLTVICPFSLLQAIKSLLRFFYLSLNMLPPPRSFSFSLRNPFFVCLAISVTHTRAARELWRAEGFKGKHSFTQTAERMRSTSGIHTKTTVCSTYECFSCPEAIWFKRNRHNILNISKWD